MPVSNSKFVFRYEKFTDFINTFLLNHLLQVLNIIKFTKVKYQLFVCLSILVVRKNELKGKRGRLAKKTIGGHELK